MTLALLLAATIAQARIEGTVVNALTAAPVRKVEVSIHAADNLKHYAALTSNEGKFTIEHIHPGEYRVNAKRPGYLEKMNGRVPLDESSNLNDLVIKLSPAGVVSGRVIDEDGDPLPEVSVVLSEEDTQSDAEGHFVFTGLKPGRYALSATSYDLPDTIDDQTFVRSEYPTPIDLKVGSEVRNLEIHMHQERAFTVRGKLSQTPPEPVRLRIKAKTPDHQDRTTRTQPDGVFEFEGVAAGSYFIRIEPAMSVDRVTGDYIHKAPPFYSNLAVEVSQSLKDLVVPVGPSATIHGTLRFLGPRPEKTPRVEILGQGIAPKLDIKEDATFQIASLPWRDYGVIFYELPDANYVKTVRFNGEATDDYKLDLTSGGTSELEIVIAPNAAEISGKLPQAGTAYLWRGEGHASVPSRGTDGEFVFRNLAPGEYHVVALEGGNALDHDDPESRKQFASFITTVTVQEGSRARVDLKIVPTQEQ